MSRNNIDRQEAMRIAAERRRLQKEKEEREENEFYERITTGTPWMLFKAVVIFCTAMAIITTIEFLVDGPSEKITKADWEFNQEWDWQRHKIVDVKGYTFAPEYKDWSDEAIETFELVYSPIFRTGKKLRYELKVDDTSTRVHEQGRFRSVFDWFPFLQLFLLIPLFTFIFKRQSPWFNLARIASFVFVFPGILMVIFFAMM